MGHQLREPGAALFLINPTALFRGVYFGENAKFFLILTNKKWPLGIDPSGHHFVVLNISINMP